ncbi:uncharacterized protein [Nicotiana sylvestris]|uniref:uncharacterized protein n=1 Tax=Nicotiana sylvestris TaxID=4096 RepID=UPI00388C3F38
MTFVLQIMSDLERLQRDLAYRHVVRPNDVPRALGAFEALMSKGELIMSNQELDASSIDPSREVEELDVNSMKEEMYKLKQQMAEMYQAWEKGQPPPAYPANPAFIPPLTQTQEHPTVDSSAGFPIYHHYQGTTSQTPQAPPPKPVPYPPPLITLVFVASPSDTLHQSSKAKKPSKNPEQEEMFSKVKSFEQSFRDMRGLGGFKMPKFDLYDGHGDPVAHLRGFYSKMRGDGRKDELLMAYFSQNRLSLTKLEKKHSESFREYGFRWREQVTRVEPPMKESEMVDYFLQALEPTYYGYLVSTIGKSFNEVVKMGGMVEEGLKSNKIMSYSAIKATTQDIQGGT